MLPILQPMKRCTKCGVEYPATLEYFHRQKEKSDGLHQQCKFCRNENGRQWHRNNRERALETQRRWREQNPERHRESLRRWRRENPEKQLAISRRQRAKDRVKIDERVRVWRLAHPDKVREYQRNWNKRHPDKRREWTRQWAQEHPDETREMQRRYRRRNSEKYATFQRNRKARKLAAKGTFSAKDVQLQIKAQTNSKGQLICWWCDKPIKGKYHVDHRIALAKGGGNSAGDIVISHPNCNQTKSDKMPWEFNGRLL